MLRTVSLGWRVGFSLAATSLGCVIAVSAGLLWHARRTVMEAEQRELLGHRCAFDDLVASRARLALALASSVGSMPPAQEALSRGDREGLQGLLRGTYERLAREHGVRQFQFHTPPATSFLRLNQPDKYGDDLSSFRGTVVAANARQESCLGLENGVTGLGIRGVTPVALDGRHVGSVEFGMELDQDLLNTLKAQRGAEVVFHALDPRRGSLSAHASTGGEGFVPPEVLQDVLRSGESATRRVDWQGRHLGVLVSIVKDYQGRPAGVVEIAMDRSVYVAATHRMLLVAGALSTAALAVSGVLGWRFSRSLRRSLAPVVRRAQVIASGDLSQPDLAVLRQDEIGRLRQSMNEMSASLAKVVRQVSTVTRDVASAAAEIAATSEQIAAGTHDQSAKTLQVSSAIEEMSATVTQVAGNVADAAATADEAGRQAAEGGKVVQQTVHGMRTIAEMVTQSAEVVNQLGQRSEQIGLVIGVINDIADQTNLLALNAAIEAARAGEHGRGFAVVADEVRKLAERTAQSTQEVARSITAIQQETGSAVEQMNAGSRRVAEGLDLAEQAGRSLEAIVRSSGRVAEMIQSVAATSTEQSAATEQISRNVDDISTVTRQSAEGVRQAARAAEELAHQADELQQLVQQFTL